MTVAYQDEHITVLHDDCLVALRAMPDESVSAVVTDPPYGLANTDPAHVVEALTRWAAGDREFMPEGRGFMGKAWDAFVPPPAVWDECMRVLKPGGHLLAFAGSRTFDLMALSIRFAGFDIRDSIAWLYGSGFPKSMDVGKAITGHESGHGSNSSAIRRATMGDDYTPSGVLGNRDGVTRRSDTGMKGRELPLSENGQRWSGWGTALKPAFEPIVVARKPFPGTVAANVLAHGTGALNIDGTRNATTDALGAAGGEPVTTNKVLGKGLGVSSGRSAELGGRWPANVMLDESQAAEVDRQAPATGGSGKASGPSLTGKTDGTVACGARNGLAGEPAFYGDTGGASRFFYVAKAPSSERPEVEGTMHATVKPLDLMQRLVRLVTPPGGVVLEPFAGSGTTVEACLREGFTCIAIEREADYLPLIMQRIQKPHTQSLFEDWDGAA